MIERNVACIILGSHFGVDTFFVLSGFLLTYTTFNRLKKGFCWLIFNLAKKIYESTINHLINDIIWPLFQVKHLIFYHFIEIV